MSVPSIFLLGLNMRLQASVRKYRGAWLGWTNQKNRAYTQRRRSITGRQEQFSMSPDSNTTIAESTTVSQDDVIPILDVGAYLRGDPGALDALAAELREAMENIGFYYLAGHDVPLELIHGIFGAAKQFHAQPLDAKMALKANEHNVGYMPVNGSVSRASQVEKAKKPNLVEAFFLKRDLPLDHPDVVSEKRYRCANQWPEAAAVPGFRATAVAYMDAMESLCKRMLPVYARAMDLPADWFDKPFDDPQYTLRLSHYPPSEVGDADQYGLAPHTDSSFLTMLAQADLPGLSIRMPDGRWVQLPVIEGAFVVNSGDLLRRWSNHRILSTPHRAINTNPGADRYAVPFFFDATIEYPMECIPTCTDADNPPKYETISYLDYMLWFTRKNYDHVRSKDGTEAVDPGVPKTQSARD
jgi:isopenicillin N synthase-like dioxygenase